MKHFIFDCDGVLLDWQEGFIDFMRARNVYLNTAGPNELDLSKWIGCDTASARSWVARFNASWRFAHLSPIAGAVEVVETLRAAGHSIDVLSCCADSHAARQDRMKNLHEAFGDAFSNVELLPLGTSKFEYLWESTRRHGPENVVFVEDRYMQARHGLFHGAETWCLRRSHNRTDEADHPDGVTWADDFAPLLAKHCLMETT